jgi:DNA-binding FadR family transcriptional regulator
VVAANETKPPRLRQPRLADMIAERFRGQILDGTLLPGERLPRQEALARELGVSLTIVREALRILEAEGRITVHRGKSGGATVHALDYPPIPTMTRETARFPAEDVRLTIIALDGLCAQTAAALPDRAALTVRLRASLAAQTEIAGDEAALRLECIRFHTEIGRDCGLMTLQTILSALEASARHSGVPATRRCERAGPGTEVTVRAVLADHARVVAAIERGDRAAAASAAAHEPRAKRQRQRAVPA